MYKTVEKVAERHFFEFFHPVLAPMARSAPNARCENLWVFIRSDARVVRAGLNIRGCGPLSTPGFFDRLKAAIIRRFFYCIRKPPAVLVVLKSFSYAQKKVCSFGKIAKVCQPRKETKGEIKSG